MDPRPWTFGQIYLRSQSTALIRLNVFIRAKLVIVMATAAHDLLVLAEAPVKSAAVRFARRLGAAPSALEFERLKPLPRNQRLLVYLSGGEPPEEVKDVLRTVSKNRYEILVLYSVARAPETAAKWGMLLGEMRPKHAHLSFDPGEVAKILDLKASAKPVIDIGAIRKQLIAQQKDYTDKGDANQKDKVRLGQAYNTAAAAYKAAHK